MGGRSRWDTWARALLLGHRPMVAWILRRARSTCILRRLAATSMAVTAGSGTARITATTLWNRGGANRELSLALARELDMCGTPIVGRHEWGDYFRASSHAA